MKLLNIIAILSLLNIPVIVLEKKIIYTAAMHGEVCVCM
jgi:predicted transposase YbfD/YdcC